ncbi:MAG: Gfo/Idh/MocA family oxidoreductase [Lentisphaeria bacterium]|nr:Gfo/Idh/MocA family oxidoreductase [Lentisphaeria bacterium]
MPTLKFGLIGCGRIAEANHIPEIRSLGKKAVVAAVYDPNQEKAHALADKFQWSPVFCKTLGELLASDVDAVIIATPNSLHYPQTLAALNAGKHVLVEKPMASTIAEADEMIDLALKKKLVLQVNQSLRYHALYARIAALIQQGVIGRPLHARCLRTAFDSPDVLWSPGAAWFVQKKFKGSLVTDIAVHMADALSWFFGPVKTVSAQVRCLRHEVPDNVTALFRHENGADSVMELSWTFPFSKSAFEIYGEEGSIVLGADSIEILKKGAKKTKVIPFKSIKAIPNSHASFLKAVAAHDTNAWNYGRNAIALCMAILESDQKHICARPHYRISRGKPAGSKNKS